MRIIILTISLTLILWCRSYGQTDVNHPGTMLWRVTREGSQDTSWIFGTLHFFTQRYFYKFPVVLDHVKGSEIYINEMVWKPKYNISNILYYTPVPDSIQWAKLATKKQRKNIYRYFRKNRLMSRGTRKMHIGHFNYVLYRKESFRNIITLENGSARFSIDNYLEHIARKYRKKVYPLEGDEEFFNNNKEIFCNGYRQTISEMKSMIADLDSVVTRVKSGNNIIDSTYTAAFNNFYNATVDYEFDRTPDDIYYQNGLHERNNKWIPQLIKHLTAHSAFIAVGYGHLMYTYGIIAQLRKTGFTVEPVPMQ